MTGLFDEALRPSRLFAAWGRVRANKGCAGADGVSLSRFEQDLERELAFLREEVMAGRYRPRPLLRVEIHPQGRKPRMLAIPAVRDRVLQTAVANTLTPLFEAEFEACSFAYRQGRSVDMALAEVRRWRDAGYRWVVDADISSFFDELDHALLMSSVTELVPDPRLVELIRCWVRAEVREGDVTWCLIRGVPQGSPIAPHLANLYLDRFDEALLAHDLRLVRYSDDFVVLCKNRRRAEVVLELTEEVLTGLRLHLNRSKTRIVDFKRGFRFLGAQFVRSLMFKVNPEKKTEQKSHNADNGPVSLERSTTLPPSDKFSASQMVPQRSKPKLQTGSVMAAAFEALAQREGHEDVASWSKMLITEEDKKEKGDEGEQDGLDITSTYDPLLRTLYLTQHGCVLARDGERLVVRQGGQVLREIPALMVDQVVVLGNVQLTTQAMHFCLARNIPVLLLSSGGAFRGMIHSFDPSSVWLQRAQFQRAKDPDFCLETARAIVTGKITNARLLLRRRSRKRMLPAFSVSEREMAVVQRNLARAESLDALRGFEGIAARYYFQALAAEIDPRWGFWGRRRRPPPDPVNALLSFGYMLLYHNVYTLVCACGLHPYVGFLHPLRRSHPALVSDLMEEFRALVVDATVLALIFNRKLQPDDFEVGKDEDGGCRISDHARRCFIQAFERKLNSRMVHPRTGRQSDYRRCIAYQARQLAAAVQDDAARPYRPLVLR